MTDRGARILPILLSSMLCSVLSISLSFWFFYISERKWCRLMVTLDEGYNAPVQPGQPPLTERGRRLAEGIHDVRKSLPCGK